MTEKKVNEYRTIGDLFKEEPSQWGFRGDPYLWFDMREYFSNSPLPDNEMSLLTLIKESFEKLTGHEFDEKKPFGLEKYAHGGMSSGMVSPEFWHGFGIDFLMRRYAEK
ncbi:MAG: hypothetical protein V4805_06420 [Pseudomonadota bacterium]